MMENMTGIIMGRTVAMNVLKSLCYHFEKLVVVGGGDTGCISCL